MPIMEILDDDLDARFAAARRELADTRPGTPAHERAQAAADALFAEGLRTGAIKIETAAA